jgi:hypothetical protein
MVTVASRAAPSSAVLGRTRDDGVHAARSVHPILIEQAVQGAIQGGQLVDKHLPDKGVVNCCVAVNQDIAESDDARQLGNARGKLDIELGQLREPRR